MKKLFTLIALLAICFGAKAETIVDAEVDFSKYTSMDQLPKFSWNGSQEAFDRLSIVNGCLHWHSTEVTLNPDNGTEEGWRAQWFPIGGVNAEVGVTYTLHYKIKGDHAENISALGFGLTPYGQLPITTEWVEGTFNYECSKAEGDILMQAGSYVGDFDIAYLKITHEGKKERPATWKELLVNGNAEKSWAELGLADVKFDDMKDNIKVCFWSKEKGHNMNENNGWDPFVGEIVVDPSDSKNHAFICRAQTADTEGDAAAWDNQIWIQSPRAWKSGETFKLSFRYKASEPVKTQTQMHKQKPSDYLHYVGIGDIEFTTDWQTFEKEVTVTDDQGKDGGMWSVAFNLNPNVKTPVDFYFDDLSWGEMVLDHGLFVASKNTETGLVDYDYDNATEFTYDEKEDMYVATVGTKGKKESWVNEIQISTVRGNDRQFKANTIKVKGALTNNIEDWKNFEDGANAKISLPAQGVWTINLIKGDNVIAVEQIEGDAPITANPTKIVINAVERDWKPAKTGDDVEPNTPQDGEEGVGEGQVWDNQFVIMANRELTTGEKTIISFKYKAAKAAKVSTQVGGSEPGQYVFWNCIGDVNFTTEEQEFLKEYTIPKGDNDADITTKSITFNLSEMKDANTYEFYNIIWKIDGKSESLIDQTGDKNFYVKTGAGTTPAPTGITEVTAAKAVPTIVVNLAGQRVSKDYKGIVIKGGKAVLNK